MQHPPIIFLDIDEVLWFTRVKMALQDTDGIDPVSTGMLRRICDDTGAKLVITSTWRSNPERCKDMFDDHSLTPYLWSPVDDPLDDWRVESQNSSRSLAICNWLDDHPDIDVWAIFDDSRQDFGTQMLSRLVHVNPLYGIGIDEYRRATKLLGFEDSGEGPKFTPRYTIANLAKDALAALDQGDENAVRSILETITTMPVAQ